MTEALTSPLATTEWLELHLSDPKLRLLDATAFLVPRGEGKSGYVPRSGRAEWENEHIPNSQHVDLVKDLSDPNSPIPFTMPSIDLFCQSIGQKGISDESSVVIYSAGSAMWATRLWWMLQSIGFENCGVLDGGLAKWKLEGRPVCARESNFPKGDLTPRPISTMWATKQELIQTLKDNEAVCVVNTLSPKDYSGERANYGRPGHIPGSENIFYHHLMDERTGTFLPIPALKKTFSASSAFQKERVICYCGGGISSTMNALALRLCGHKNVAVYDGSMLEWSSDPALPLTVGERP